MIGRQKHRFPNLACEKIAGYPHLSYTYLEYQLLSYNFPQYRYLGKDVGNEERNTTHNKKTHSDIYRAIVTIREIFIKDSQNNHMYHIGSERKFRHLH